MRTARVLLALSLACVPPGALAFSSGTGSCTPTAGDMANHFGAAQMPGWSVVPASSTYTGGTTLSIALSHSNPGQAFKGLAIWVTKADGVSVGSWVIPSGYHNYTCGPATLTHQNSTLKTQRSFTFNVPASSGMGTLTVHAMVVPEYYTWALVTATVTEAPSQCPPGNYSATGYAPCTPASPGHFVDTIGATTQTPCLPNTYQPNGGATSCLPCPGGTTSGSGATACTAAASPRSNFNFDARSDVFWRNSATGQDYQWWMNGNLVMGGGYSPSVPTSWTAAAIGDVNGDGAGDVFWRDNTGLNYVWIMSGLSVTTQGYLPSVPNPWIVAGMGDASGDGKADVFWRNATTGQNYLWVMNGLTIASQGYLPNVTGSNWEVVGIADYDSDLRADVLWRNKSTGQNYLWLMSGVTVASQGFLPNVAGSDWEVVGSPDANGDGKADVLWRHKTTGQNYLWIMNGLSVASQGYMPSVADANWKVVGFGDYDGDGKGDVLWRNATTGQNYVWILNGMTVASQGYAATVVGAAWVPVK